MNTPDEVTLRLQTVHDVECIFADVSGYPRGKLVPSASFAGGSELRIAQAIPMQSVTGEYSYHPIFPDADPDVRLVPDYTTLHTIPWATTPRALAIHDCVELTGEDCLFAPRSVLKEVLARYRRQGLEPVVAPEIEFYLTALNPDSSQPLTPPVNRNGRIETGQSAFSLNLLNDLASFWEAFRYSLEALEIRTDTWVHEVGLSQFELNLQHGDPLAVADQAFLFKYAAKEVALRHGMQAVFMAKPIAGQPGSSMHLHQSVLDREGRNIFSLADGSESPELRHYIAGLQAHLPEWMLIFAPFVNSYRRFVRNSQAPVNCHWGYDNRTAGLRVPDSEPSARRVENRLAGADANPYLAIAASLAAGLDGLEQRLAATEPRADSGYDQGHTLPRSLDAALARFDASDSARRWLGERFVIAYTAVKELELDSYLSEVGSWERHYLLAQV